MTDVVAQERMASPTPSRLSRVRCIHCAMPAACAQSTCWSCGLDPTGPVEVGALERAVVFAGLSRPWHTALLVASAATLVLVALLGTVLMLDPQERSRGVRGIAARIRGESWPRAEVGGATAEFPSRPVRSTVPLTPGATGPAEALVASAQGIRVELRAAAVDEPLSPAALVDAYAAATGQQVRQSLPVSVRGAPGFDAAMDGSRGRTRVRAVVTASSAYLLVVTGPLAAFERFTASFATA